MAGPYTQRVYHSSAVLKGTVIVVILVSMSLTATVQISFACVRLTSQDFIETLAFVAVGQRMSLFETRMSQSGCTCCHAVLSNAQGHLHPILHLPATPDRYLHVIY
jgi:hypothetical protein